MRTFCCCLKVFPLEKKPNRNGVYGWRHLLAQMTNSNALRFALQLQKLGLVLKLKLRQSYLVALRTRSNPYKSFGTSKQFRNCSKNKLHLKKCRWIDFIIHTLIAPAKNKFNLICLHNFLSVSFWKQDKEGNKKCYWKNIEETQIGWKKNSNSYDFNL